MTTITRLTDNVKPLDVVGAINDNANDTVIRLSVTEATGSTSQGVYVDANGVVQVCDAVTSTYSASGTAPVNGTAVASAISGLQSASTAVTHTASTAVGSGTQPVYIASDGTATITTYTLAKSVPSDAVFTDTTYSVMTGAGSSTAGTSGLVPAPASGDSTKYLKGDGTWATPTDTTYSDFTGATGTVAGTHGLVPAPTATDNTKFLKGDGTWATVSTGATSLSALTDTTITSPSAGQLLSYDGTTSKWINSAPATVDQTYGSTSTNAQSGTAVAQAVASKASVAFIDW